MYITISIINWKKKIIYIKLLLLIFNNIIKIITLKFIVASLIFYILIFRALK